MEGDSIRGKGFMLDSVIIQYQLKRFSERMKLMANSESNKGKDGCDKVLG